MRASFWTLSSALSFTLVFGNGPALAEAKIATQTFTGHLQVKGEQVQLSNEQLLMSFLANLQTREQLALMSAVMGLPDEAWKGAEAPAFELQGQRISDRKKDLGLVVGSFSQLQLSSATAQWQFQPKKSALENWQAFQISFVSLTGSHATVSDLLLPKAHANGLLIVGVGVALVAAALVIHYKNQHEAENNVATALTAIDLMTQGKLDQTHYKCQRDKMQFDLTYDKIAVHMQLHSGGRSQWSFAAENTATHEPVELTMEQQDLGYVLALSCYEGKIKDEADNVIQKPKTEPHRKAAKKPTVPTDGGTP